MLISIPFFFGLSPLALYTATHTHTHTHIVSFYFTENISILAIYFTFRNFLLIYFFLIFFYYEQSYLSIYWTDFHDFFFTKWKVFVRNFSIQSSFSDSSRDVAIATNFVAKLPNPL